MSEVDLYFDLMLTKLGYAWRWFTVESVQMSPAELLLIVIVSFLLGIMIYFFIIKYKSRKLNYERLKVRLFKKNIHRDVWAKIVIKSVGGKKKGRVLSVYDPAIEQYFELANPVFKKEHVGSKFFIRIRVCKDHVEDISKFVCFGNMISWREFIRKLSFRRYTKDLKIF